ncbi:uncharacterized protein [Labrus bergylta]
MHDVKKGMEPDSQSAGRVPKEENNTKALNNVFRNGWLKLAGPASKSLVIALSGSAFVALSDNHGSRREAEELTEILPMPKGKEADGGVAEVPVREGTTPTEPPARIVISRTPAAGKSIKVLKTYRIVLLGETKAGKSSLANTIFEEDVFKVKHSPTSGKSECQADSKSVDGRRITLIETLDFFGKDRSEEELRREVGRCMTASAPGPHAFFIVLKVERSPDYWKDVIQRIAQYLPEAFNYAAVVFTHGDQLQKGMKIEEFVEQNKCLSDLVKKCGGRCHVVDNKYWTTNQQGDYRSNKLQVAELLNTTDKILMENKEGCYKMQRAVQTEIEKGGKRKAEGDAPQGDPSETNNGVSKGTWIKFTGPAAKSLAGLFGPAVLLETEGKDDEEEEDVGEENKVEEEEEEDVGEENKVEEEEVEEEGEKKTNDEESDQKDETETEKTAEDKKVTELEKGKETEKKAGAGGGLFTIIGSLFGIVGVVLAGAGAGAAGAVAVAVAVAVAAGVWAVRAVAVAVAARAWAAKAVAAGVAFIAQKIYQFIEFLKTLPRLVAIILLVVVFFLMLLLSFGVQFPFLGTLLQIFGVLLMFTVSVVLLILL